MVVPVRILEILTCDKALFQDMGDHRFGTISRDALALGDEFGREIGFFFIHSKRD